MKYRIVITAVEPNPNYEEKRKEYEKWRGTTPYPNPDLEVKKLETVLSEEEFVRARNAILGTYAELAERVEV